MPTKIFVNLPIKDLEKSKTFFTALGYTFNAQFSNEKAACMVISEDIFVMLLTEPFFQGFISTKIANAHETTEVLVALSADSREEVETQFNRAIAAGATETRPPEDHGFMYSRSFNDLDGHIWELVWMDPAAVQPG